MDVQKLIDEMMPTITTWGMRIVGAVVALIVAWIVAGYVRSITRKAFQKAKIDETLGKFFSTFAKWAVLAAAIVAILGIFGIETTSFAAILGAAGLAIGLAFQGTLGHLAAGVMLLVFRPFKVGDVVRAGGEVGKVDEISLFVTTLDTPDNRRIIIPNSKVAGGVIENLTHHKNRRVDVAVGTDYGADLQKTREVLEKAIQATGNLLDGQPHTAVCTGLGDSSINWSVRVYCNQEDYWGVMEQLTVNVKNALDEAGIGIPYPQMDVHVDNLKAA